MSHESAVAQCYSATSYILVRTRPVGSGLLPELRERGGDLDVLAPLQPLLTLY